METPVSISSHKHELALDIDDAALTQSNGTPIDVVIPGGQNPGGQSIVRVPVTGGETVRLPFAAEDLDARLDSENGNLAIKSGDTTVILQGYADANAAGQVEIVGTDSRPIDVAAVLAETDPNIDIQTAAGPAAGAAGDLPDNNGGLFTPFDPLAGIAGLDAVGGLAPTALAYNTVQRTIPFYDPQEDTLASSAVEEPDDVAPVNFNDAQTTEENTFSDSNIMIVLDVSGSMKEDADSAVAGIQPRIDIAKAALANLLHTYDVLGDVRVTIVAFDIDATIVLPWDTVGNAIAAIDGLSAQDRTNYDAALEAAADAWIAGGKLGGDVNNVVYFLSDGKPTWGGGFGNHLSATDKADWDAFLESPANGINHVYAVGIGDNIGSVASPDPDLSNVAHPDGDNLPAGDVIYVKDPLDLSEALSGTVEGHSISGNVLDGSRTSGIGDNGTPGSPDLDGNGATHIARFTYDGTDNSLDVSFTWDGAAGAASQVGAGGGNVSISGREIAFDTDSGRMIFNFDTGDYTFTPGNVAESTAVAFHYATADADGDVDLGGGIDADGPEGGADLVISITPSAPPVETPGSVPPPIAFPEDALAAQLAATMP